MQYPELASVVETLGGRRVLREPVRTLADLERLVARGLPFRSLERLGARYAAARRAAVEALVLPRTTRLRREASGVLSAEESERLERLARVTALAEQVFEDREAAEAFLLSPHALLGGVAPLELAVTDLGARRVEDLLWRLEYALPV